MKANSIKCLFASAMKECIAAIFVASREAAAMQNSNEVCSWDEFMTIALEC